MIKMEKVIKELESLRDICNAKSNMAIGNGKVAWAGYANAAEDAIAMLKEQEAKPVKVFKDFEAFVERFTKCRANDGTTYSKLLSDVLGLLKSQQAEIERLKAQQQFVHCPDCLYNKNCISTENGIEQDGFCKWGKRKDGGDDIY